MNQKNFQNPLTLMRSSFQILAANKNILQPIIILGFIQLLALEMLYFAPRFPLNSFLGPIIKARWDESFLHYPLNFLLLPSLFYEAQVIIYVFIGGALMATAVLLIHAANTDRKVIFSAALKETFKAYVHIFLYSILSFALFALYNAVYQKVLARALKIRSESGPFFILKKTIITGDPYFQFVIGILITALLVYMLPYIIVERRNFFQALWLNLKFLFRNLKTTFLMVTLPMCFYLPLLVTRSNIGKLIEWTVPEIQFFLMVLTAILTVFVDVIVLTSATTYFLLKKENS